MTRVLAGTAILFTIGLGACSDPAIVVEPVIDVPAADERATPFPLDEITLTVAHAGDPRNLVSQTFTHGASLDLSNVPFDNDLVIHMEGFVAASSQSYGRTCAFAFAADGPPPAPHIFFSRSLYLGQISITPLQRFAGRAIDYLGTGLFIGGLDADHTGAPVTSVEQFDPLTGAMSTIGELSPREGAVEALLGEAPPHIVLLGGKVGGEGASFFELVDPGRPIVRLEENRFGRLGVTATSLTGGDVAVIGGRPPGMPPVDLISTMHSDGATVMIRDTHGLLAHPRSEHTATRLGNDVGSGVLIAGGLGADNLPVAVAELFKPLSDGLADPATFAPVMIAPRWQHAAARMPDGSVLIIGGLDATGQPVRQLEQFTIESGFVSAGMLPANAGVIDFTTTTLADGRILIAGGRTATNSPRLDTAYIASLNSDGKIDVVPTTNSLSTPRAGHQAVLLCDGTVLIAGGTDSPVPAERYSPAPTGRR